VNLTSLDRHFYLAVTKECGRFLKKIVVVRPETILSWHRKLVQKKWNFERRHVGRPAVTDQIRNLVVEMKKANPKWGCQRIMGELKKLNLKTCKASVLKIIRESGLEHGLRERMINIGVDVWGFYPVPITEIEKMIAI
jgi:putative transposase